MSKQTDLQLPVVEHLTQEELRQAVMRAILQRIGIDDPAEFLAEHSVQVKFNFRPDCGVSVAMLAVEPRATPSGG